MPLSRVREELHPKLLIPLSAKKNEAIVTGNTSIVKRIQALMKDLNLQPGKPQRSRQISQQPTKRSISIKEPTPTNKNDTEIDLLVDELIEGRDINTVDPKDMNKIINNLKQRKEETISEGDYQLTQHLENLIQDANTCIYNSTYHSIQDSKLSNLKSQLMEAQSDFKAADEYWAGMEEEFTNEYNTALNSLKQQQKQQLEDFDNSFPDVLPANYRKVSIHVLQLREQERHLVLSKRYEEAIPFRERADKLENEELEQQRKRFLKDFNTQRKQLVEAQRQQMQCFDRNWERKWGKFEKEKSHEISVLKKTIANFERRIKSLEAETEATTAPPSPRDPYLKSPRRMVRQSPAPVANTRVRTVAASRVSPTKKPIVRRVTTK
ncbi:hypothetical protein GPJ56_003261 [Histomonas meleagridis]|uniref:uncharacterized protein n=1 Tax=Histomonas meleagridis TaxID=135588 RepID=UPI0035594C9B|nr:hypothetical protein GPJ56_003261 [Histomonas meleagridis]KAH0802427.1 hypothetical protein GO595_004805 [Histomonas meleagridis]